MALPLLSVGEYEAFTGTTLTAAEDRPQIEAITRVASARLRDAVSGIDDRLLAATLDRDLVIGVMVEAVALAFDTISVGLRVKSVQYPEWSTEYAPSLAGLVSFTPAQIASLTDTVETGAFSIRLGGV